jgi:isocitrate dehydrogenase
VPSLELIADKHQNAKATVLAKTLDEAVGRYLENGRAPSRKVNEIDNRGSTFYLTLYWAQALAAQDEDAELKARFAEVAEQLARTRRDRRGATGRPGRAGRARRLLPAR